MRSIPREQVPVVIDDNGVELRVRDEDGLSVGFVRLPAGADLRPATKGLPTTSAPARTGGTCSRAACACTPPTATKTSSPARRSTGPRATPPRRSRTASTSTSPRRTSSSASSTTSPLKPPRPRKARSTGNHPRERVERTSNHSRLQMIARGSRSLTPLLFLTTAGRVGRVRRLPGLRADADPRAGTTASGRLDGRNNSLCRRRWCPCGAPCTASGMISLLYLVALEDVVERDAGAGVFCPWARGRSRSRGRVTMFSDLPGRADLRGPGSKLVQLGSAALGLHPGVLVIVLAKQLGWAEVGSSVALVTSSTRGPELRAASVLSARKAKTSVIGRLIYDRGGGSRWP